MKAGNSYVIDLASTEFDAFLRLQDENGKTLAENDDIVPDNSNSRIVFTPDADATFRIVASALNRQGTGAFTITIREVAAQK